MKIKLLNTGIMWIWITAIVFILDQVSKSMAAQSLVKYQSINVLPFFDLTLAHNAGAAFSVLSDASGWQRWFFSVTSVVISIIIVIWMLRLSRQQKWIAISLALILGGAVGNVWDRMTMGYVIDFLDFYIGDSHWPAFNVADIAITIGAILMLIDGFFLQKNSTTKEQQAPPR